MDEFSQLAFQMIGLAGDAKGYAYEALAAAEANDSAKTDELIAISEDMVIEAHKIQFTMIQKEANGERASELSILIVHAQDHLMTTVTALDLLKVLCKQTLRLNKLEELVCKK